MAIQDELVFIESKLNEAMAFYEIRRQINGVYSNCVALEQKIIAYQADGLFDSIPIDTKQAYNRLYQLTQQLKAAIENDPDFEVLINY